MRNLLDYNVVMVDSGPEPTLRELVHKYYNHHILDKDLANHYAREYCNEVTQYIDSLTRGK